MRVPYDGYGERLLDIAADIREDMREAGLEEDSATDPRIEELVRLLQHVDALWTELDAEFDDFVDQLTGLSPLGSELARIARRRQRMEQQAHDQAILFREHVLQAKRSEGGRARRKGPSNEELWLEVDALLQRSRVSWTAACERVGANYGLSGKSVRDKTRERWRSKSSGK